MTRNPSLLDRTRAAIWVVDMQERLLPSIDGHPEVVRQVVRMLEVAQRLSVPAVFTEQYPRGLGPTVAEVREYAAEPPFEKTAFSAFAEPGFEVALKSLGRDQLVLCGIEAHICVMEGALDGLASGYQVTVVADAVGSGSGADRNLALDELRRQGVTVLPSESVIYQMLGRAATDEFRGMIDLLRRAPAARA
ncbi:MAG: isochorismatase family protein [Candidatus Dormibacteria bacterium]